MKATLAERAIAFDDLELVLRQYEGIHNNTTIGNALLVHYKHGSAHPSTPRQATPATIGNTIPAWTMPQVTAGTATTAKETCASIR